jgi:NTE family protein
MILKFIALLLLITFILLLPLYGQETSSPEKRKTVAVVLSGGGAKGVAHVGVLKALEEKGIAIDYITGTSVGAMVGGMYAAGYSPDEILELMSSQEFSEASTGRLNKKHDYYFYKNDPTPAWITFNYSFEHILSLERVIRENIPSNLVSPGMMDFMFMQYLSPASNLANNNFDSLLIPFRCVASDITNKRAVIMQKGNLSEAVRASMTFPFYFKPILVDSMVLFDGGMFNNFPADVAMECFQPDIIIGSVVAANPNPPSVNDLLSQLENMLMVHSDYNLPKGSTGIILHPVVPPLNVTDFSQNSVVFASGYREVLRNLDSILGLKPGRTTEAEMHEKREIFRNNYPHNKIRNIVLNKDSSNEGAFAKAFLKPTEDQITLTDLQNNYYRLLSLDKFRHIYPRLVYNKDENLYDMQLDLIRNYSFHRSFGGNLSSQSINQFFAMFAFEKLGKYPLSIYTNFFVGNNYNSGKLGVRTDFLKSRPFYLLAETSISRWNYAAETLFLLEEQKPSFIIQHEYLTDLRLVFPSGYKGKWETGLFHSYSKSRYYNTNFFSRTDKTDLTILRPLGLYVGREINTLNHNQYPTSGSFLNIKTRLMSGKEEYEPGNTSFNQEKSNHLHSWWEMGLKWENFFLNHRRFRSSVLSEVFLSNRPLLVNITASRIMSKQYSPFPLAATRYLDAFRSNHFFAGGLKGVFLLNRNWLLQAEAHFFHSFKEILPDINHSARYNSYIGRPTFMYHTALVFHTPLGPLSAGLSYFEKEEDPLAFVINFGYILFNRKTF